MGKRIPAIDRLRRIEQRWQAERVSGVFVDAMTARLLVQVYDALNPTLRPKFERLASDRVGLVRLAEFGWKHAKFETAEVLTIAS